MYLHLGQSFVTPYRDIIGIFDLDTVSTEAATRAFLTRAEKEARVVTISSEELPRSFVLCGRRNGPSMVYLSQRSSATLRGRVENNVIDDEGRA